MPKEISTSINIDRHFYKRVISDLYYLNGEIKTLVPSLAVEFSPVANTVRLLYSNIEDIRQRVSKTGLDEAFKDLTLSTLLESNKFIAEITNALQFQDIIEQKLDHITKVHQGLIDELYKVQKKNKGKVLTEDLENINKVAKINSAQLMYVTKEYKEAISIMKSNIIFLHQQLKKFSYLLEQHKVVLKGSSLKSVIKLLQSALTEISIQKDIIATPSDFIIAVKLLITGLEKLFTGDDNSPFIIKGKWKAIMDMYTIESEKLVFQSVAHYESVSPVATNDEIDGIELF